MTRLRGGVATGECASCKVKVKGKVKGKGKACTPEP